MNTEGEKLFSFEDNIIDRCARFVTQKLVEILNKKKYCCEYSHGILTGFFYLESSMNFPYYSFNSLSSLNLRSPL